MGPCGCYGIADKLRGDASTLVTESGAYPGPGPCVFHILRKMKGRHPEGFSFVCFRIQNTASSGRDKLRCTRLLPVVMAVCYDTDPRVCPI